MAFTEVERPAPGLVAYTLGSSFEALTLDGRSGCGPDGGSAPSAAVDPNRPFAQPGIKKSCQGSHGSFLLLGCHGDDNSWLKHDRTASWSPALS